MKRCTKCGIEKELIEFNKKAASKDGHRSDCKTCSRNYLRLLRTKNKKLVENKDYKSCTKCGLEKPLTEYRKSKSYYYPICKKCNYQKYKNKTIITTALWRKENKEKIKITTKKYYQEKYIYIEQKRRKTDTNFRLKENISSLVRNGMKYNGYRKSSKTTEILGLSIQDFRKYLESKFETWMTWENYGKYNGELNYGWDIDHIKPIKLASTEEEIIKLNHYTNLQPLCSKINRDIKKDFYIS